MNWIVRGACEWHNSEDGLVAPKAVDEATEDYRFEMDRIAQFIQDECLTGTDFEAKIGDLYAAYNTWVGLDDNTEQVEGKITFSLRLEGKGFQKGRTNSAARTRIWKGIGLKRHYPNVDKLDKSTPQFGNFA